MRVRQKSQKDCGCHVVNKVWNVTLLTITEYVKLATENCCPFLVGSDLEQCGGVREFGQRSELGDIVPSKLDFSPASRGHPSRVHLLGKALLLTHNDSCWLTQKKLVIFKYISRTLDNILLTLAFLLFYDGNADFQ